MTKCIYSKLSIKNNQYELTICGLEVVVNRFCCSIAKKRERHSSSPFLGLFPIWSNGYGMFEINFFLIGLLSKLTVVKLLRY